MALPNSILLVDDEAHIRRYMGAILKKMGVKNVFEAVNGDEAMDIYQRELPSVVLLDVSMPGKHGVQVLREMRGQYPHAKVVMMTSIAAREVVQECIKAGAISYLLKEGDAKKCEQLLKGAFAKIGI